MKRYRAFLKQFIQNIAEKVQENLRYLFVALIFIVFGYYNLAIAPVAKISENKSQSMIEDVFKDVSVDMDATSSEKMYPDILRSHSGDWYRAIISAQALDMDEVLHVFLITPLGEEREIGRVDLKYDVKNHDVSRKEFVFETAQEYSDIIIRRQSHDEENGQGFVGGRIGLLNMDIARLDVKNAMEASKLQPTLFGQTKMKDVSLPQEGVVHDVTLDDKTHFLFGQSFDGIDGNLSDIALNIARGQNVSDKDMASDKKYRLELREYDKDTQKVGDNILAKDSFTFAGLQKRLGMDKLYHFDFPVKLDKDKSYFLGLSDTQIKKKGGLFVDRLPKDDGYIKLLLPAFTKVKNDSYLLTGAKLEDIGSVFRYTYQSHGKPLDFVDLFETAGDVHFNKDVKRVLGDSTSDSSFMYKIDTIRPFTDLRIQATEVGVKPNQVRLEYSYDKSTWQDITFTQEKDKPQKFDMRITDNPQKASVVFVRVNTLQEDADTRVFGLDMFQVTALVAKNIR